MKKIVLLSALVLGLGFTSCDGYEEPNPPAQSNPQESVLKTDEVTVTGDIVAGEVYNLTSLNNNNTPIKVATIQCDKLPAGYEFETNLQASIDGFATSFAVPSTVQKVDSTDFYNVFVTADDLNGVYVSNVTKNPAQVALDLRFNVLTKLDSQLAYVGGPKNFYTTSKLTIAPFSPDHVIENAYYLVGNFCDWTVSKALKFDHPAGGDPYDNPVFSLVVEVTNDQAAAGYQFKVIPQSTFAAGTMDNNVDYGATPIVAGALEGYLDAEAGNGVVNKAGRYLLTIDMEALTYKFQLAFDYMSVATNVGPNVNDAQWKNFYRLHTSDYVNYSGFSLLYQGWFLSAMPAMDGINFMANGDPVTDEETGVTTGSFVQIPDYHDGTRIPAAELGMYKVEANILDLTYTVTRIRSIALVGAFNDWNEKEGAELTPGAGARINTWTATVHMTPGEFKLVANHSWGINWGGSLENLVQDGDNLSIDEEGDYTFTFMFGTGENLTTLTIVKK